MAPAGKYYIGSALWLSVAAGWGCATRVYLPPGSRPAGHLRLYNSPDFRRILPGRWRILAIRPGDRSVEAEPNIFRRYAQIAGIKRWSTLTFLPSGGLLLEAPGQRTRLNFLVEGNELSIGSAATIEHDNWELAYVGGRLYLRSLVDSATLRLQRIAAASPAR